jgi:microcystin-dependent protein
VRFPQADIGLLDTLARCWPVGSVFVSAVATDPAELIGFGTWQAFGSGRVLVGVDAGQSEFASLGDTGGVKDVTLDTTQMPSHTHTQDAHTHTQDAHTHVQNAHTHVENCASQATGGLVGSTPDTSTNTSVASGYSTAAATAVNQNATATNQPTTATNQNTGGGQAHSNLQPYIVVHFWKRVG